MYLKIIMCTFFALIFISPVYSIDEKEYFYILGVSGKVSFKDNLIKPSQFIAKSGLLITEENSFVKLYDPIRSYVLILGPHSRLRLSEQNLSLYHNQKGNFFELINGAARFFVFGNKNDPFTINIFLNQIDLLSTYGDFIIISNDLFQESEAISLQGQSLIHIKNPEKPQDITINQGQWIGAGTRFQVNQFQPVTLPEHLIQHYQKLEIEANIKDLPTSKSFFNQILPDKKILIEKIKQINLTN